MHQIALGERVVSAVHGEEGIDLLAEKGSALLTDGDQLADRVVVRLTRHRGLFVQGRHAAC